MLAFKNPSSLAVAWTEVEPSRPAKASLFMTKGYTYVRAVRCLQSVICCPKDGRTRSQNFLEHEVRHTWQQIRNIFLALLRRRKRIPHSAKSLCSTSYISCKVALARVVKTMDLFRFKLLCETTMPLPQQANIGALRFQGPCPRGDGALLT